MKWFTVRDNITGEMLTYGSRYLAINEVEHRVALHKIYGHNAKVIESGHVYIVTEVPDEEDN